MVWSGAVPRLDTEAQASSCEISKHLCRRAPQGLWRLVGRTGCATGGVDLFCHYCFLDQKGRSDGSTLDIRSWVFHWLRLAWSSAAGLPPSALGGIEERLEGKNGA